MLRCDNNAIAHHGHPGSRILQTFSRYQKNHKRARGFICAGEAHVSKLHGDDVESDT